MSTDDKPIRIDKRFIDKRGSAIGCFKIRIAPHERFRTGRVGGMLFQKTWYRDFVTRDDLRIQHEACIDAPEVMPTGHCEQRMHSYVAGATEPYLGQVDRDGNGQPTDHVGEL